MYILYEKNTNSELDRSMEELDIINTIGEFYGENLGYRFRIVNYDEKTNIPNWWSINNIGDYEAYIHEYNTRAIKNKTCMQLKREILDIQGIEPPKTKKLTNNLKNSKI